MAVTFDLFTWRALKELGLGSGARPSSADGIRARLCAGSRAHCPSSLSATATIFAAGGDAWRIMRTEARLSSVIMHMCALCPVVHPPRISTCGTGVGTRRGRTPRAEPHHVQRRPKTELVSSKRPTQIRAPSARCRAEQRRHRALTTHGPSVGCVCVPAGSALSSDSSGGRPEVATGRQEGSSRAALRSQKDSRRGAKVPAGRAAKIDLKFRPHVAEEQHFRQPRSGGGPSLRPHDWGSGCFSHRPAEAWSARQHDPRVPINARRSCRAQTQKCWWR